MTGTLEYGGRYLCLVAVSEGRVFLDETTKALWYLSSKGYIAPDGDKWTLTPAGRKALNDRFRQSTIAQ